MARTKRNAMNIAEARQKIRTSQLINRLQNHVDGEVEMVPSQVTAALGLLKKSLPDLQATIISGDPENPLEIIKRVIVDPRNPDG